MLTSSANKGFSIYLVSFYLLSFLYSIKMHDQSGRLEILKCIVYSVVLVQSRKVCSLCLWVYWANRNDKLYQRSSTTTFTGPTGYGKSHLILNLIEELYRKHFDCITIICPTLQWNKTHRTRAWIRHDDNVWLTEQNNKLCQRTKKLLLLLPLSETLFIIDDIIDDESLDKWR